MNLNLFQADSAENSAMTGLAHRRADGLAHLTGRDAFLLLQLFADGAEGASADAGGTPSPDAGESTPESFDDLIRGKYKADFDNRVQAIIKARFRQNQALSEDAKPIISSLAKKYGMTDDADKVDLKALQMAMTQSDSDAQRKEAARRAVYESILSQANEAKKLYPALDLNAELDNPAFARLLHSRVPVQTAYEVVHKDEILRGSMAYAAKVAAQKVGAAVQANARRPAENGLSGSVGANVNVSDPRFLTKEMRQDIRKRVRRGEKIIW